MSWVRLAIALSALGFVISRFGIFLQAFAISQHLLQTSRHLSPPLGIALILLGPVIVLFAARRYFQIEQELATGVFQSHYQMIVLVVVLAVIIGILLAVDAYAAWRALSP